MNWRVVQTVLVFLGILFVGSSRGAECWRLVYIAGASHADSGLDSTQTGQIVHDVQYTSCTAAEPNVSGLCSCYPRRAVGRFWVVIPQRCVGTHASRPSASAYLWRLTVSPGKDTDTERVVMRRIRNRIAGTPCMAEAKENGFIRYLEEVGASGESYGAIKR